MKAALLLALVVLSAACIGSQQANETNSATANATTAAPEPTIEERCAGAGIKITSLEIKGSTATATAVNSGAVENLVITSAFIFSKAGQDFPMKSIFVADLDRGEVAELRFENLNIPECPQDFDRLVVTADCPGISDTLATAECV